MTEDALISNLASEQSCLWLPHWQQLSPIFRDLAILNLNFALAPSQRWPSLQQLNSRLQLGPYSLISQASLEHSGLGYEAFIGQHLQIPTRDNWHDFFNAVVWKLFPNSKRTLNQLHLSEIQAHGPERTRRRDAYTLIDECGVILAVSKPGWQRLLKGHQWRSLFWEQKQRWGQTIQPFVLGHALYEQGFSAHEGWCGKALLVQVEPEFFSDSLNRRYQVIDGLVAAKLEKLNHPKQLYPLPMLGVPPWQPEGIAESYFDNRSYFCPAKEPCPYRPIDEPTTQD